MANFYDNYRDTKTFPQLDVPSTIFRDATQDDNIVYQSVTFRKQLPNGEYSTRNLLLAVPATKTSDYDTYGENTQGFNLSEEEIEKVREGNRNRLDAAIRESKPRLGLSKSTEGSGEGEIFGAIDVDNGQSLTAKATSNLISDLDKQGYSIYSIQEPEYVSKSDNGYRFGDFIKSWFNIYPQRGKVTGTFPSNQNEPNNKLVQRIREYGSGKFGGR